MLRSPTIRRGARILLAIVRLTNGTLGFVAPGVLIHRVDPAQTVSPAGIYAFRLFGMRTVFLGADLLVRHDTKLQRALRHGLVIHSCDVATSVLLGVQRQVNPRMIQSKSGQVRADLMSAHDGGLGELVGDGAGTGGVPF